MHSNTPDSDVRDCGPARDGRRVIVVAGMHRAGTSVVARALGALGVDLGDRLMAPDARMNPRGFFEDHDIVALDDGLLDALGADWKNVALLDGVDWSAHAFAPARTAAKTLINHRLSRSGRFAFKDPRVARLIPFWQRVFADVDATDAYVIAVRNPLSVIASLTARDGLDPTRSGWLWLGHLLCALRYSAGRQRVIVDYDRLLDTPLDALKRMALALGLPAPAPNDDEVRLYTDHFLSKELRHTAHAPSHLDGANVPQLLIDAYMLVRRLATDEAEEASAATRADTDALWTRLATQSPLLAYAGSTERAADEVPRLRGELDWARASFTEAKTYAESLEAALANVRTHYDDISKALQQEDETLAAARASNEDLMAALRRKDETIASAQAYNEDLLATLRRKDEAIAGAQAYNEDLLATLRRKDEAIAGAQAYNEDLVATLRRKDEAIAGAQAYNEDLVAALRRKDEMLVNAQTCTSDLSAALRRKDQELDAANSTLERIRDRIFGRMLLRRIARGPHGG